MKGFGPRLKELRERRGLTQEDLARAVGTEWMLISRYERGIHLPAADNIVGLSQALHVTTDLLLRGDRTGEERLEFKNLRLYERFRVLDELPRQDQDVVVQLVDAVIAKRRMEAVLHEAKQP